MEAGPRESTHLCGNPAISADLDRAGPWRSPYTVALLFLAGACPAMSNRPLLIGASPRILHEVPAELGFHDKSLQYMEQSVAHWVMSLGASCVMLPTVERGGAVRRAEVRIDDLVELIDGLVLQGGSDAEPQWYGQQPSIWSVTPIRCAIASSWIDPCLHQGRQAGAGHLSRHALINVALGGTCTRIWSRWVSPVIRM